LALILLNVGVAEACAKQIASYIALACLAAVPDRAVGQEQG